MTALADIVKALASMPPVEPGKRRFVVVGKAAMYSLRASSKDPSVVPNKLANSNENYPLVETDDFPGWEIVDKAVPS